MFSTYEINPWPYFHIMFFNSVYRLPKKTVKIEEEPLLAVEGGRWCTTSRCMFLRKNFGQCGTFFQSHELILNMKKNRLQSVAVISNYFISLSMVYWFIVETSGI